MKILITILAIITEVIFLPQAIAGSPTTSEIKPNKSNSAMKMPMYQPPRRGAPSIRVGGGTRGISGEMPSIHVLAPDHVGLTENEQPTLSWYMSKPGSMRVEVLVVNENAIDPILEIKIDAAKLKEGIQSINLADYGVKLKPGLQYQWSVVLTPEKGHHSGDIASSGMIELKKLTSSVKSKLKKSKSQEDVFIYAQEGYWYDAMAQLTTLIKKNPKNESFKKQRKELLKQVGL
jgi:hypothetical protein